jgi:hypothetical protein
MRRKATQTDFHRATTLMPAFSNDDMEAAMKTRAARMVLATSVALATLAAAETAYAQDYQSYEAAYVHRRHAAPPYAYDT